MIEIFAVLKSLRIPESVLELSMMIYRYIFVFLDQAAMIHNAQVMRLGDVGARNSLSSFAMLSSVLFLRSWEQGERLIVAMDARCYNGVLDLMDQSPGPKPMEVFAVMAYLAPGYGICRPNPRHPIFYEAAMTNILETRSVDYSYGDGTQAFEEREPLPGGRQKDRPGGAQWCGQVHLDAHVQRDSPADKRRSPLSRPELCDTILHP